MKITKSKIFLIFLLFFIAGVALKSFIEISIFGAYLAALTGLVLAAVFWPNKYARFLGLGGIFLFLGIWRLAVSTPAVDQSRIEYYNGAPAVFAGVIVEEPDVRRDHVKLKVKTNFLIDKKNRQRKVSGKVLINVHPYPEYEYGDKILVSCKLKTPEPIEDFQYDKYLARYNIYSLCYYPENIKILSQGNGSKIIGNILKIKKKFVRLIGELLPEPQASFLGGLLYGARRSIPRDLIEDFKRTGTTHIIAISGYNITILAVISQKLLQGIYISRKKSFWITMLLIVFFVIVTGAPASVVRAAVMGILVLLAGQIGRTSKIFNALAFTAAAMLFINPKILRYDVGWQLSFLATLGLIYFSPIIDIFFKKIPEHLGFKEVFISTISAIIFTLPIILYNFGRLSLSAPIVNMLVLPVIPWAMAAGFLAVFLGSLWFQLGQAMSLAAWFFLTYIIKVVSIFSEISWSSWEIKGVSWPVFFIYLPLFYFIKKNIKGKITKLRINNIK